VTKEGPENRAN